MYFVGRGLESIPTERTWSPVGDRGVVELRLADRLLMNSRHLSETEQAGLAKMA